MWFLTCCALLGAIGVEAGIGRPEDKTPTVHAFNCDRPSVVKQYDAVGRCARTVPAFEPEGRPTEYTVLTKIEDQNLAGFSCSVVVSRRQYYCGFLSYATPAAIFEIEKNIPITPQQCKKMSIEKKFEDDLTHTPLPISVPGVTVLGQRESGAGGTKGGQVACQGESIIVRGQVTKNIVTESFFKVKVKRETFTTDGTVVQAPRYGVSLSCAQSVGGCGGVERTFIWPATPLCMYRRVAMVSGRQTENKFVGVSRRMLLQFDEKKSFKLPTACGNVPVLSTQVKNIVAMRGTFAWSNLKKIPIINEQESDLTLDFELEREFLSWQIRYLIGAPTTAGCSHGFPQATDIPVRIGHGEFGFLTGSVWTEFRCKPVLVQLRISDFCYDNIPVHGTGVQFVQPGTHIFVARANQVPCPTLFPTIVQGLMGWWKLPEIKEVPALPTSDQASIRPLDLRPALFTQSQMSEWNKKIHLPYEQRALAMKLFTGICSNQHDCPVVQSNEKYNLHYLVDRSENMAQSMLEQVLPEWIKNGANVLWYVGASGGLVYICQLTLAQLISWCSRFVPTRELSILKPRHGVVIPNQPVKGAEEVQAGSATKEVQGPLIV